MHQFLQTQKRRVVTFCMALFGWAPSVFSQNYCVPTLDCTDGDLIKNFSLVGDNGTNINKLGYTCSSNGYEDYTSDPAVSLFQGGNYSVSLGINYYESDLATIWIDFNDNGTFEPVERVMATPGSVPIGGASYTLSVPVIGNVGLHRMREMLAYSDVSGIYIPAEDYEPCNTQSFLYGQVHDYQVNILTAPCTYPGFTYTISPDCFNDEYSINFNISDLGSSASLDFLSGQTLLQSNISSTGTYNFGPFATGSLNDFTIVATDNSLCKTSVSGISFTCPSCFDPSISYDITEDCNNNEYLVEIDISDLDGVSSVDLYLGNYILLDDISNTGTYTVGPFPSGSTQNLKLVSRDNTNCIYTFDPISYHCPATSICGNYSPAVVNADTFCTTVSSGNFQTANTPYIANPGCFYDEIENDLWYAFVATDTMHKISISNLDNGNNNVTGVAAAFYNGSCNALNEVYCTPLLNNNVFF